MEYRWKIYMTTKGGQKCSFFDGIEIRLNSKKGVLGGMPH